VITVPTFRSLCGNCRDMSAAKCKIHRECTNGNAPTAGMSYEQLRSHTKAQSPLTLWLHCPVFPVRPTCLVLFLNIFPKPTAMPERTPKHCHFEPRSSWVSPFRPQSWDLLIRLHRFTMTASMGRESGAFNENLVLRTAGNRHSDVGVA